MRILDEIQLAPQQECSPILIKGTSKSCTEFSWLGNPGPVWRPVSCQAEEIQLLLAALIVEDVSCAAAGW